MKTKNRLLIILPVLLVSLILTSCYVESNAPMGPSGKDGWSDIKTITYDIYYDKWVRDNSETNLWFYDFQTGLVDNYVINNGTVLFYYGNIKSTGYVDEWFSIPFTNIYFDVQSGRNYETIFDASYSFQFLRVKIRDTYPGRYDWAEKNDVRIKAIILEGTQYNYLKDNNVDTKDYNSVIKSLNNQSESSK